MIKRFTAEHAEEELIRKVGYKTSVNSLLGALGVLCGEKIPDDRV
jgi:hypothetical protein